MLSIEQFPIEFNQYIFLEISLIHMDFLHPRDKWRNDAYYPVPICYV